MNDDTQSDGDSPFSPDDRLVYPLISEQPVAVSSVRELCFRHMRDGFSVVDLNGIHVDVNPAFCQMTGYSQEELIGSGPAHLYWPPEEREHIRDAFAKTLSGEFNSVELNFMHKDGERFPVIVNPFAIRDESGTTIGFAATVTDITRRIAMQRSLQESEERYRGLFENAGDAIVILQGENVVDYNKRALDMFGVVSPDQMESRTAFDFFPPKQPNGLDSRAYSIEKLKAVRAGQPQSFAWSHVKLDGTPFSVEVSLSTFEHGESTFIQAIIRDITERERMEQSLMESEYRYRNLFDSAGDGILIMQSERVVDCNERMLELYGVSRDQLMNLSSYALSAPTQPNGRTSREYFVEKVAESRSGTPQIFEWRGNRLDGAVVETEVTLTTFMQDGVLCTQSLIRDITQRKAMEKTLQETEQRYRRLFENAGDAVMILKDGQVIDCNDRALQLTGHTRDEILSNPTIDYFPPAQPNGQDSLELFLEKVEASLSGIPQIFEWTGQARGGRLIDTEVTLTSFVFDEERYIQSFIRDISERKQLEGALLNSNKSLEDRVLQRTQELEIAYSELLQRNVQYRALAHKLTQAEEDERKRIAQLLHDDHQQLLVAAKFKAELLGSHLYGSDINAAGALIVEILEQALDVTRSLTMELAPPILYGAGFVAAMQWLAGWMEEHHQLQVVVIGSLPVTPLPAEVSNLLFRAVRELLFNVSKHSGVTQAHVSIAAFDQGLRVVVSDKGCGFDVEDVLQAPRSYGLFSIREQLVALDGQLDITSVAQRGTVSTLSIPVPNRDMLYADALSGAEGIAIDMTDLRQAVPIPIRILVADDHALARDALVQILSLIDDFEIVGEAVDGLDAVEQTRLLRPDVVLMDATMPRLNGPEAIRRIIAEVPRVKVIGLSMHARGEMEQQMLAAGAACYMQKLTPVEELFSCIRGVMANAVTVAS